MAAPPLNVTSFSVSGVVAVMTPVRAAYPVQEGSRTRLPELWVNVPPVTTRALTETAESFDRLYPIESVPVGATKVPASTVIPESPASVVVEENVEVVPTGRRTATPPPLHVYVCAVLPTISTTVDIPKTSLLLTLPLSWISWPKTKKP